MAIILSRLFAVSGKAGALDELSEAAAEEPVGLILDPRDQVTGLGDRVTRLEVKTNVLLTINVAILLLLLRDLFFE